MSKKFFAGQKVRILPDNEKINPQFFNLVGTVIPNEPSGLYDYYVKFDNEKFAQGCYAFNEEELEAVPTGSSRLLTLNELINSAEGNNLPVVFEGYEGTHFSLQVHVEDGKLILTEKED